MLMRLMGTGLQEEQALAWVSLAWSRQAEDPPGPPALKAPQPWVAPPHCRTSMPTLQPEAMGLPRGALWLLGPIREIALC